MSGEGPSFRDWRRCVEALATHAQALEAAYAALAELQRTAGTDEAAAKIGFGPHRRMPAVVQPVFPEPPQLAKWATAGAAKPAARQALQAYPGYGNAPILLRDRVAVGIFIAKADEAKTQAIVDSAFYSQRDRQDFVPVFVTESSAFRPFVAKGYIFEYLPPVETNAADAERAIAWRKKRLDFIKAKWGISHFINDISRINSGHALGSRPKVIVFPDYGAGNPYMDMMYSEVRKAWDVSFGTAEEAAALAAEGTPVVFHLHWEDAVYRGERRDAIPARMASVITAIDRLKQNGGHFIWTVHNLQPHETSDLELHKEFMRQLVQRADILHVNSQWAADSLLDEFGQDLPVKVIDHPSYTASYPTISSRAEAAAALNLPIGELERTFLFFGNIRRYKGLERLLNVAPEFIGRARFIIAGRSGRFDPAGALPPNCLRYSGFIDDLTLARLFAVAHYAVLPFERLTTSGSLLLALSFGVPVVAPNLPAITELVSNGREAFLYDPAERGGLAQAIERAIATPEWHRAAMAKAAAATAAFAAPEAFSAAVRDMYADVFEGRHGAGDEDADNVTILDAAE